MKKQNLRALVTGALMVALAVGLSFIKLTLPGWAYGGSVTLGSMVPIILFSQIYGIKWGLMGSLAYSLLQMIIGFYPPPTQTVFAFVLVVLLDYMIAFGVLGLAGALYQALIKRKCKVSVASALAGGVIVFVRFLCHFFSGILIWDAYAPQGMPVWVYSLGYNGAYMLCEIILTVLLLYFLTPSLSSWMNKKA